MLPIWALGYDDSGFCFSDQKQPHSCTRSLTLIEESEDGLIDGLRDRSIDMIQLIEELFLHRCRTVRIALCEI
jgi:hypothetical protein